MNALPKFAAHLCLKMLIFDLTRVQHSVGPVRGLPCSRQEVSRSQPRNGESHSVDQVRIATCHRIIFVHEGHKIKGQ